MIVKEFYLTRKDGINLFRIYSTLGYQIQKIGTNEVYDEAIDVENSPFQYLETSIKIEIDNNGTIQ